MGGTVERLSQEGRLRPTWATYDPVVEKKNTNEKETEETAVPSESMSLGQTWVSSTMVPDSQ